MQSMLKVCLLLLFYAITTFVQLYHGGDMMFEMMRKKPKRKRLQTQGIFNLPRHIGMI